MEPLDADLQSLKIYQVTNDLTSEYDTKDEDTITLRPRKQSYARSMSVPNSIPNVDIFPKENDSIPSVTISDFSSNEMESNTRGFVRFNSLPQKDQMKFCCRRHRYNKTILSPALSMSSLRDKKELTDAEPETP